MYISIILLLFMCLYIFIWFFFPLVLISLSVILKLQCKLKSRVNLLKIQIPGHKYSEQLPMNEIQDSAFYFYNHHKRLWCRWLKNYPLRNTAQGHIQLIFKFNSFAISPWFIGMFCSFKMGFFITGQSLEWCCPIDI